MSWSSSSSDSQDFQIFTIEVQVEAVLAKITRLEKELRDNKDEHQRLLNNINNLKETRWPGNFLLQWTEKFPWSKTVAKILNQTFKLKQFRPKQLAAINATLAKKDVILVMPTCGGKSLTYQLPALVDDYNITIVVSPLVALIENQLIALEKFGIKSAALHNEVPVQAITDICEDLLEQKPTIRLMFVTPEWLASSRLFMAILRKCNATKLISRVAIDEVHCCSTRSHDFRPGYRFLGTLKQTLPEVPFIGLTSTATTRVVLDVQNMLSMPDAVIIREPISISNLHYRVAPKPSNNESAVEYLEEIIREDFANKSGIIYTTTITECINLYVALKYKGLSVALYHGKLKDTVRTQVHRQWLTGHYQVLVATSSFGMGIDKPDVLFVIHDSMPKSLLNLYQESGRAGRDGSLGQCIVMFSLTDFFKLITMTSSLPDEENVFSVLEYCLEKQDCRHHIIAKHFEEPLESPNCGNKCDNCERDIILNRYNVSSAIRDVHKIIRFSNEKHQKLTFDRVIGAWLQIGPKKFRVPDMPPPKVSRKSAEMIIGHLMIKKYLKINKDNPSKICHLEVGLQVTEENHGVYMLSGKLLSDFPITGNSVSSREPTAKRVKRC